MLIEVKGVQFKNKGAELMLLAVANRVKSWGNSIKPRLALSIGKNLPYDKRQKYEAYQKLGGLYKRIDTSKFESLLPKNIKGFLGIVTHKDIDIVLDASGFSYGQQWTSAMLQHSVRQAKLMHERGAHYIFLPQAFGPFKDAKYKRLIKEAIHYSSLVFARDETSFNYIKEIVGECDNLFLFPDFTNLVESKTSSINSLELPSNNFCLLIPNSKMFGKKSYSSITEVDYIEQFSKAAVEANNKGFQPVVLNHEGGADAPLCQALANKIEVITGKKVLYLSELDALQVKSVIGSSKLVICSRFHGCVSALSQGVPVIGTSWSHKYEMLFKGYDAEELLFNFESKLPDMLRSLLDNMEEVKVKITDKAYSEKVKSNEMWSLIENLLFEEDKRA
jgi:colanic acid/amylovoran biosynthesis protein